MEELKKILEHCFETGNELGMSDGYDILYSNFKEFYEANKDEIELAIYRLKEKAILE